MKKNFDGTERFKEIDSKRLLNKKLSYDDFEVVVLSNDEVSFIYNNFEYEIVHNESVQIFRNMYYGKKLVLSECVGEYNSAKELLQLFKINGLHICEFWNDARFNSYYG